jgi:hypothetical protein
MQPELRFINELLSTETDEEASTMLLEGAAQFGAPLLEMFDAVEQVLAQRGENDTLQKLVFLREQAERALS